MAERNIVKTTCPYCGVGCGVLAEIKTNGEVTVQGDTVHPSNYGRLCSKGAALGQTVGLEERLLYPHISDKRVDWDTALTHVADKFKSVISEHGPESVAFYVSGQLLTEDYYVANKLMKGYIASANIDTNSRLCMSSSVAGHKRAFGSDTVPCCYEDLELAKLIVFVGSNAAWCHPVLYQRIVQAKKQRNDLKIVVIDPRKTATCDIADVHLPLRSGSDAILFNGLLTYLADQGKEDLNFVNKFTEDQNLALVAAKESASSIEAVATACGLAVAEVQKFYQLFAETERTVSIYSQGINQSSSGTDKVNAIINCHLFTGRIGRQGMGPFSFTGQPNAMGGREVGGLANTLAAHMEIDNPEHREIVQTFWQSPSMVDKPGLMAVDLFQAIDEGKVKAVWIMATNPVVTLPDADRVQSALDKCDFVVVSDIMQETDTTACADVLLPALGWGEKEGTVTNSERRISRQRAFLSAPGEAKADWWIISQVAQRMGFAEAFKYSNAYEVFKEHARLSGYENQGSRDFDIASLASLSQQQYDDMLPVQWPVIDHQGTSRIFSNNKYFTPTKKARFVPVKPRLPINATSEAYPLVLNTGRVRDQWHTMTRTSKAPRLSEHSPEPYVDVHPDDAKKTDLEDSGLAVVSSQWGKAMLRVRVTDGQAAGSVFAPMHWNNQFSSAGRIDSVVNPVVDPISGQPESKYTPVKIEAYTPTWHGFLLTRRRLSMDGVTYWARATGDGFYRYEFAGEAAEVNWPGWARGLLCQSGEDINWVEYYDANMHRYRGVRMEEGRVESCIFIAPTQDLPSRSWLASLFVKSNLTETEHKGLLLAQPPVGTIDVGRIVCACFSVGVNTISQAIKEQNITSVDEIGKALKAGTNCGSCVPELKRLLK